MCLMLDKLNPPKKAKEDIKCYKILLINGNSVVTPYVGLNICKCSDLRSLRRVDVYPEEGFMKAALYSLLESFLNRSVSTGFIHSYKDLLIMHGEEDCGRIISECVIPKGTRYYDGYSSSLLGDNKLYPRYASRRLIINKIL